MHERKAINTSGLISAAAFGLLLAAGCEAKPSPDTASKPASGALAAASASAHPQGDKACCMGLNECKGQGGCAVPEGNSCAGKNECKGKGGCNMHCPKK